MKLQQIILSGDLDTGSEFVAVAAIPEKRQIDQFNVRACVLHWLDARGDLDELTSGVRTPKRSADTGRQRCGSFENLVFERHALGVVLLEPPLGRVSAGEHFDVVFIADLLVDVDVDKNRHPIILCARLKGWDVRSAQGFSAGARAGSHGALGRRPVTHDN